MIIIDIIKRIHHKTKRKCRRYHEIIMDDDQKEVIRSTVVGGHNPDRGFRINSLQLPLTLSLLPNFASITFCLVFIRFVVIIFFHIILFQYSYYF